MSRNQTLSVRRDAEVKEQSAGQPQAKTYLPAVDIIERSDDIVLRADLPGVDESALEITVEKNELTLHGKAQQTGSDGFEPMYIEFEPGDFHRVFTLSNEVDPEKITATFQDGVLELVLSKASQARTRRIPVKSA